jgi:hypothetical protein
MPVGAVELWKTARVNCCYIDTIRSESLVLSQLLVGEEQAYLHNCDIFARIVVYNNPATRRNLEKYEK